jgi:hypothetical protein
MRGFGFIRSATSLLASVLEVTEEPLFSPGAQAFIDGTASALVAEDVTRKIFGPLLRQEVPIPGDPFLFDAHTLRGEQLHPQVMAYYESFTESDLNLLNSRLARWYASESWWDADRWDLTLARDRIFLGLRKMGYPEERIDSYLEKHGPQLKPLQPKSPRP